MKKYVGVDLGGTNVRAALVSENGVILNEKKIKTEAQNGPDAVTDRVINLVKDVIGKETVDGIGIGLVTYVVLNTIVYLIDLIISKKDKTIKPNLEVSKICFVTFILFLVYFLVPTIV